MSNPTIINAHQLFRHNFTRNQGTSTSFSPARTIIPIRAVNEKISFAFGLLARRELTATMGSTWTHNNSPHAMRATTFHKRRFCEAGASSREYLAWGLLLCVH